MRRQGWRGFVALGMVLAVAACGKKTDHDAPIAFVPADTPYVIAALEPVPEAAAAQLHKQMQGVWPVMMPIFEKMIEDVEKFGDDESTEKREQAAKTARVLKAVLDEVRGRDTPEKWRELGLGSQVRSAIYGVGLLPVVRTEILDADALRATIARVEQKVGEKLGTARIGEQDIWTIGDTPVQALMAIEGKHLVITLVPGNADEALKRRVLGLDRPAQSLADTKALADFNKARGYLPYASGWVDTRRVFALINDDPTVAAFAQAAGEPPPPALDAACRAEFDAIAAKAPRLAFGYTQFDTTRMTMHARLDLDPTLAKSLATLPGALPGTVSSDALFDIAFALPVLRARDFLVAQADAIAAAPFKCEMLAKLNDEAAKMKTQIEQTIPPPLADLVGVRLTIDDLVLPDATNGTKLDFSGRVLVGSNNPSFLTGLAQMTVPALQKIQLPADGKAVAIPSEAVPGGYAEGYEIHAAMGAKTLGVAVGKDQAAKLETAVAAAPATAGVLLESGVSGNFYRFVGDGLNLFAEQMTAEQRESLEAQRKLYAMYSQWFKRIGGNMSFGAEGIDLTQDVELVKP